MENQLLQQCHSIVESRKYAPSSPFLHASIVQNRGGGLCMGLLHFHVMTITDQQIPGGCAILALSLFVGEK